jgi:sarcosine oxidase/L-pipecolate oxidase
MSKPQESSILIIGGGTFGTSSAYHLAQRGYTSVKVLNRFALPYLEATDNDINQVVRANYPEPLDARLACEASALWSSSTGLFKGIVPQNWLADCS